MKSLRARVLVDVHMIVKRCVFLKFFSGVICTVGYAAVFHGFIQDKRLCNGHCGAA